MISLNLPLNFSSFFSKLFQFNLFSTQPKYPKRLPIGIQTFDEMINENYVYIDKTEYICKLIQSGKTLFRSQRGFFEKYFAILN